MKWFSWLIALFTAIIFASCSSDSRVIVEIPELNREKHHNKLENNGC